MPVDEDNRGRQVRWPLAVAVAIVLAGCSGAQSEQRLGQFSIYVHGDSLLPRGGEDALLEGQLVARDGCVLLGGDPGTASAVIWPSGTSIIEVDPVTLRLPSGEHLKVGQRVSGGGGAHDVASDRVEIDIDEACLTDSAEVLIFNPDDDLTTE